MTEELLSYLATSINGSTSVNFQGKKINLSAPFKRLTFQSALKETLGVDINDYKGLFDKAKQLGLEPQENISTGKLIMDLYDKAIEPNLIEPTFMIDHPWETSPLAKKKEGNPDGRMNPIKSQIFKYYVTDKTLQRQSPNK